MELPNYAEIHVVSDLHMGGSPAEFQILRESKRLAAYVRWVARQQPNSPVALVLNGDVIDTLAESVDGYIAIDEALTVVQRIMSDASFACVWDALADFVKLPNRSLVIVIGNHDVELALPPVQRAIVARLAGEDRAARASIEFATQGAGYTCTVGNARVFCTHGNEVDPWNYVRYEDLSKAARRLNCGRSLKASQWDPNAGTKLVKDVMNEVKRRYAWIDLLKPETQAAIGVLLVMDPRQAGKIAQLPAIAGTLAQGAWEYDGRLSVEGFAPAGRAAPPAFEQLLGPSMAAGMQLANPGASQTVDEMLLAAETNFANRRHGALPEDQTLGLPRVVWDRLTGWIRGVGKHEALRRALVDWLETDKSFDVDTQDFTFKEVTASVGTGIDFIVTGHSHLERAIDMGGRYYFNCGTWIRLLRFSAAMLKNEDTFKPVYDVLENGKMSAIDAAVFANESFVLDRTSAVCIKTDPRGVVGTLAHVDGSEKMIEVVREFVRG